MASRFRLLTTALLGLVFLVSACDDDDDDGGSGPDNGLTSAEAGVLIDQLVAADIVSGDEASLIAILLTNVADVGTMNVPAPVTLTARPDISFSRVPSGGTYDVVAFQIDLSVNGIPEGAVSGLLGWKGIDVNDDSVEEIVLWTISGPLPLPTSISSTFDTDAFGSYYEDVSGSTYFATTGTAAVSNASFTGSFTDCSGTYDGLTVDCDLRDGDMAGNFNFTAELDVGGGTPTTAWPNTTYNVPAIQFVIDASIPQLFAR